MRLLRWRGAEQNREEAGTDGASRPDRQTLFVSYTAFISYSHALDDELAPALQFGLHRFAKPWYRLRGMRVFRDEASLSASPGLWSSIERALMASEFFLLLASPEAARSQWVCREVERWCDTKPRSHVLVVLTGGELVWDDQAGDFDWDQTTALPASLKGIFEEEPRYVDLRWARHEEHLSLRHPRFRELIADLASALRGRPKDELIGEDVRQHRRLLRIGRSMVAALAVLTLAASVAAVVAIQNARTADDERQVALAQARLATSRQLAAEAVGNLGTRLDLSMLLSLEAVLTLSSAEARSAVLRSVEHSPRLVYLHGPAPVTALAFGRDGKTLASGTEDGRVVLWDLEGGRQLGEPLQGHESAVLWIALSPDGKTVASTDAITETVWELPSRQLMSTVESDSSRVPLGVDGALAPREHLERSPAYGDSIVFSPDGSVVVIHGDDVELFDIASGSRWLVDSGPSDSNTDAAFSPDGRTLAVAQLDTVTFWDVAGRRTRAGPTRNEGGDILALAFSDDGTTLLSVSRDHLLTEWDVASGKPTRTQPTGHRGRLRGVALSHDGKKVALASEGNAVVIRDVARPTTPTPLERYVVDRERSIVASSPRNDIVAIQSAEDITLWDVHHRRQVGPTLPAVNSRATFSPDGSHFAWERSRGGIALINLEHPDRLLRAMEHSQVAKIRFSPDGRIIATHSTHDQRVLLWRNGESKPQEVPEPAVDTHGFTPDGKTLIIETGRGTSFWHIGHRRFEGAPIKGRVVAVSPDGSVLVTEERGATSSPAGTGRTEGSILLWDTDQRKVITDLPFASTKPDIAFSDDSGTAAVARLDGRVEFYDLRARRRLQAAVAAHQDVSDFALSPDGATLASTGGFYALGGRSSENTTVLSDVRTGQRLGDPLPGAVDRFTGEGNGLITESTLTGVTIAEHDAGNRYLWSIGSSLRDQACRVANRNMSRSEWDQYLGPDKPYRRTCKEFPSGEGADPEAPVAETFEL